MGDLSKETAVRLKEKSKQLKVNYREMALLLDMNMNTFKGWMLREYVPIGKVAKAERMISTSNKRLLKMLDKLKENEKKWDYQKGWDDEEIVERFGGKRHRFDIKLVQQIERENNGSLAKADDNDPLLIKLREQVGVI